MDTAPRAMLMQLLLACIVCSGMVDRPSPSSAAELLYNGIELSTPWPPNTRRLSREPMPVPYLQSPPKVICIDTGRQLFVDDFLIGSTTLTRSFHAAELHPANPVLRPDQPWENKQVVPTDPPCAMPFSDGVWYDADDRLFKMWYMGGYCQGTCYAESQDGIRWEKPSLDVVEGTNIVQSDSRDSATVWLDRHEVDPSRRFKMMRRDQKTRRHSIHFSADGIHWGAGILASRSPDRSAFFFNPFRRVWVMNLRGVSYWDQTESVDPEIAPTFKQGHRIGTSRFRRYREGADFLATAQSWPDGVEHLHDPSMWVWADRLDRPRADIGKPPEIYHLDAVAYESVLLGLFSIWKGHTKDYPARDKINELQVGFSRDGFHWDRTSRGPLVGVSEDPQAWNHCNVQSAGGCCLVVGDKLYFYVSGRMTNDATKRAGFCSTGLAVLRRDGFASMDAGDMEGQLTTRPLRFSGKHLFVNVENPEGQLQVAAIDENGNAIAPYTMENCQVVATDSTCTRVFWKGADDLSPIAGKVVRFRFALKRGKLFSFWVSSAASGASNGYVAAGGPGFAGDLDSSPEK